MAAAARRRRPIDRPSKGRRVRGNRVALPRERSKARNRPPWFVVLVVASFVAIGVAWGAVAPRAVVKPPPSRPELVPDRAGPIREWIYFVQEFAPDAAASTIAEIIMGADPASNHRVVYSADIARDTLVQALERRGYEPKPSLIWQRSEREVPGWVRDMFVMGRQSDGAHVAFLHHPQHYEGIWRGIREPPATATVIRAVPELMTTATMGRIEGGSIVSDENYAFMSFNAAFLGVDQGDFPTERAVLDHLSQEYGKKIVVLDTERDPTLPIGHADLLLAPIGGRRILLGDPRLGARLLRAAPAAERLTFEQQIEHAVIIAPESDPIRMVTTTDFALALASATDEPDVVAAFDSIEAQLVELGYEITRLPFLVHPTKEVGTSHILAWSNAVMETRGGVDIVYMPTYDLPSIDAVATKVWSQAGFRVVPIPSLQAGLTGGAVRCLSQQLRE